MCACMLLLLWTDRQTIIEINEEFGDFIIIQN